MVTSVVVDDVPLSGLNSVVVSEPSYRRSFSIKEKREYVQAVELVLYNHPGMSARQACGVIGFSPVYFVRFKKILKKVDAIVQGEGIVSHKINGAARKIHPGRASVLSAVQDDLSRFVFETRQRGIQLSTRMLRQEACRVLPSFRERTLEAKKKAVNRFTKKMGLSHRMATHTAQKNFHETEEESCHFIQFMKDKVSGKDPCDIINMDQSPIPFSFHSARTLEAKGTRTVHVHVSTSDTKRVTLAVTVDASGTMLPPMIIFKGAPNGRIANREFGTYPDGGHYACQKKAWMDEDMMNRWIDLVLVPWKDSKAPGIVPILVLDVYRVHMMGTIVNRIQSLGIEVIHIPAGCTYLCQPVDVGVNKSIKNGMREKWEDWMMEGDGIVHGAAKEPSCQLVAKWLVEVYRRIPAQTVRNAWMKKGF